MPEPEDACSKEAQVADNVSEPFSDCAAVEVEIGSNSDTTATIGTAGQSTQDTLAPFVPKSRRKRRKHKSLIDLAMREQKTQQKQADEAIQIAASAQAAPTKLSVEAADTKPQAKLLSLEEKKRMLKQSFVVAASGAQQRMLQAKPQQPLVVAASGAPQRKLQAKSEQPSVMQVASKFCPYCRGAVLPHYTFCMYCGGSVEGIWQL